MAFFSSRATAAAGGARRGARRFRRARRHARHGQAARRVGLRRQRGAGRVLRPRRFGRLERFRRRLLPLGRRRRVRRSAKGAVRSAVDHRTFRCAASGQGRRAVAQFDLDLRARGGAGDPVRRHRLSRRPGLPGRAPPDNHVGAGTRRIVGLRAGRHDDARQSRRFLQGEFDGLFRTHRFRPERGDRQARERRLRRLHDRSVGALYRPPRHEEAVRSDDPARRDLEGAAQSGGARRRRRLVQRRQMDALRSDQR